MNKKGVKHLKGKDGVVIDVVIFDKGNYLERTIQLVCPHEIRGLVKEAKENHNASREKMMEN